MTNHTTRAQRINARQDKIWETAKQLVAPSEGTDIGWSFDCTGHIGPMHGPTNSDPAWPMYSFERPAYIIWNAIAKNLHKRGWSDEKIKTWLQSKNPRWALDMDLGEALTELADKYAAAQISENN